MVLRRKSLGKGRKESKRKFKARKLQSRKAKTLDTGISGFKNFVSKMNNFYMIFFDKPTMEGKRLQKAMQRFRQKNPLLYFQIMEVMKERGFIFSITPWFKVQEKLRNPENGFRKDWPGIVLQKIMIMKDINRTLAQEKGMLVNTQHMAQNDLRDVVFTISLIEEKLKKGAKEPSIFPQKISDRKRLEEKIEKINDRIKSIDTRYSELADEIAKLEALTPGINSKEFADYLEKLKTENTRLAKIPGFSESVKKFKLLYKAYVALKRANPGLSNRVLFA